MDNTKNRVLGLKFQDPEFENKHKDHQACCLCCEHFHGSLGSADLSDVTPGTEGFMSCGQNVFYFTEDNTTFENAMHVVHSAAVHCSVFEPKE